MTTFTNKRTGKQQTCRLESADWNDPVCRTLGEVMAGHKTEGA